ncbi:MAG: Trk family potassium uptake protein [Clostridia bacterium]|nr:Trk family potassium uptake protein [Clostridia bacterium]
MHSGLKKHLSSFQIIILGFVAVILTGALILTLPACSKAGIYTPFEEALFTSTSAVCVTGLVVHDTASYWSSFGQAVILVLIQIGGLGVMTVGVFFAVISGRRISLMQRSTMQEAIASHKLGGVIKLTQFAVIVTLIIEFAGAAIMAPVFYGDYGPRGIWMAFFHSVSAFCNAGFDIMGGPAGEYVSLMSYAKNPIINITVMLLIIIGGIGFLTWEDIYSNMLMIKRYRMQSKVIFVTSGILILIPGIFFYFNDFSHLGGGERVLTSLFQSVTTRTAGFNTADLTAMSTAGIAVMIPLMLIGGSPGSTAGGMKTTTAAVLFANAIAVFKRRDDAKFFGRRVENDVVRHACAILMLYLALFFSGAVAINLLEGIPMKECLFEAASAIGTVGLSLGITPSLGTLSRMVLIALMFLGRVGGLTLVYAAFSSADIQHSKLPVGNITVG